MPGNILIVMTIIFYASLANLLLKPKPGGDYGVGYSFMVLINVGGFIIFSGFLAWNMNMNHCFDWIPDSFLRYRNWLVFLGWIAFASASVWSLDYHSKWIEGEFLPFMRWFALSKVYVWLPLLMLTPALYLLNAERMAGYAPVWVKVPVQIGFSVSFLLALGILWAFTKFWVSRRIKIFQSVNVWKQEHQASYNKSLEYINNYNEPTIQGLLKYAHPGEDTRRRDAAISKIKSFENWENDLIGILEKKDLQKIYVYDDYTYYVYAFLEGNKIEHPENFVQPILYSLKVLNIRIRRSLEDPYDLELGRSGITTVCRVLQGQFKDWAIEFKPGLLKLHEALEKEPPERKNKQYKNSYYKTYKENRLAVNKWLASNI